MDEKQEDEKQELLEIYKLHAEFANRVTEYRGTANRFFILVFSGLAVLFSAFLQRKNGVPLGWLLISFGAFGVLLAVAWCIILRSYCQLNSAKFKVLLALEKKLAYPFFKHEWKLLGEGKDSKLYRKLTDAEARVPLIFGVCFAGLSLIGIFLICCR